jgi:hypothetical protein
MSVDVDVANTRPTRLSGGLAALAALAAVGVLATAAIRPALIAEAIALVLLAGGIEAAHRGRRLLGALVAGAGVVGVVGSVAWVWALGGDLLTLVEFAPGMVGAFLIALGVAPVRGQGSRRLVQAGAGLVFLTVLFGGTVLRPGLETLLLSGGATIVAWDAGENAIGVGEQLGRRADTRRIEAVHAVATVAVVGASVLAGLVVRGVGTPGLPLAELIALLIGVVLLAGALHG